ncbi:MAG TPA: cytochrome c, partial [Bacteroidia bacterium]|nr:cytochrome c [Bacteroidia bacterium]
MKLKIKYVVLGSMALAAMSFFASCDKMDPNSPGVEYMPDMYRSPSYETNAMTTFLGDSVMTNRLPVPGTIARGYMPYTIPNDTAGYTLAGRTLHNPLPNTPEVVEQGKVIYGKFCIHCHGAAGKGDGKVGVILGGMPKYDDAAHKDLPEGKMFHSITYGKNNMGSHASQLSVEDRWKVIRFVQTLQGKKEAPAVATADSTS